jgi:TPR repeat protein
VGPRFCLPSIVLFEKNLLWAGIPLSLEGIRDALWVYKSETASNFMDFEAVRRVFWKALAMSSASEVIFTAIRAGKYATALQFMSSLAAKGDVDARRYRQFMDAEPQPFEEGDSLKWTRLMARHGDDEFQYELATMFYQGRGVEQNYAEAVRWFRRAADQGNLEAQLSLATMYYQGRGVEENYAEAVKWYCFAAAQGDGEAQHSLGTMHHFGHGVVQSYEEAVKWYRLAADQDHGEAQCNLGILYHEGKGVAQNKILAVKWLVLAANHWNTNALRILGNLYEQGQGVARNYVRAHICYELAATLGDKDAQKQMGLIKNLMTPAQIAEAEKLDYDRVLTGHDRKET